MAIIQSNQNTTALSDAERDKIEGEITLQEDERLKCAWNRWLCSELAKEVLVKPEIDNTQCYRQML